MKAVFALTVVHLVLQNRSVYAGALPSFSGNIFPHRPDGTFPHLSGSNSPQFSDDTLLSPPNNFPDYASYIATFASEIFTAVFNGNGVSTAHVISFPITDTQGCLNAYNTSTHINIAHAGAGILHSVGVPFAGIQIAHIRQLQNEFVASITRCDALKSTVDKLNCYASEITDLLQRIAAANDVHIYINRPKILYHLIVLGKSLAKDNLRLKRCLALFSHATTTEPPTSSESVPSTLSTSSLDGSSSETETSTGSILPALSTLLPFIGIS